MADMTELPVARAQALARAERAVEAVLAMHVPDRASENKWGEPNGIEPDCDACGVFSGWPCGTVTAIRTALGETE